MFFPGSRYDKVRNYRFRRIDGSEVLIKEKRKILPGKKRLIHTVQQGERTDLLADRYYRDPLKFWKLADGNARLNPESLVEEPGTRIIVPPNDPDM
jgi:hypothetical protein